MDRKDACAVRPLVGWKRKVSLLLGTAVVLGACLAVRYLNGLEGARAETPAGSASAVRPEARPASPPPAAASRSNQPAVLSPPGSRTSNTVAVVNGHEITRQELARECLRRDGKEVLESLVNKQLILQACQQRGISITQKEVDDEIVQIASKFNLSPDQWLRMLQTERDISLEQYRQDIVWPTLALRRLAADQLTVSPQELDQALDSEYGSKVQVRIISVTNARTAEQLRARAQADPESFGALAKDHSEDQHSAAARGLIPPIRRHVGDPEVERVAFALREGEISPVVHVANQYLILKCEKQIPEATIAPAFRKGAEQRLRDVIVERKLRAASTELFKRLQDEARVVNVYNDERLRQQMPGVAATINGQQISVGQLAEECLARTGKEVLEGEIHRRLLTQALQRRNLQVTKEDLDQEIARAAEAYGFVSKDGAPDIDRWLQEITSRENVTVELYLRDAVWPSVALKKLVGNQVAITPEDLQKGFQANYGERVEVLAIVLGNQRTAQEVWEMARNNPSPKFFGELAEQYSVEPVSRANYGQVPPVRRFGGQPALEKEAFALQPGELSGIVALGDKYVILKCQGRTRPIVEEIDAVRDELVKDLQEKKLRLAMADEFQRLQDAAQIDNFLAGTTQSPQRSAPSAAKAATAHAGGVTPASHSTPTPRR